MSELQQLVADDYCYLTTVGRVSGNPHTIEIWFALHERTLYMLAGGRYSTDWVKNLQRKPVVQIRLRDTTYTCTARVVAENSDEDALARRLVVDKYQPRTTDDLGDWGRTALPVAFDFAV